MAGLALGGLAGIALCGRPRRGTALHAVSRGIGVWGWWGAALAVGVAAGVGLFGLGRPSPVLPTVGPSRFARYGMNRHNNPIWEQPGSRKWSVNWTFSAGEPLQQASLANGLVYVGGDGPRSGPGPNDNLYALNAANGNLVWRRRLNNMAMSTPVVAKGRVFIGTGTQGFRTPAASRVQRLNATGIVRGTGPSAIYALNARTGQVLWRHVTPGEDMPSFVVTPRNLYVANGNGVVYAFDPATGYMRWAVPIGSYVSMAAPVVYRRRLYVAGAHPYRLYALSLRRHRLVWSKKLSGIFAGADDCSLAAAHGHIILEATAGSAARPQSVVMSFTTQGRLAWTTRLGGGSRLPNNIEVAAPTIVGQRVYVGSPLTHQEVALNLQDGRVQWRFKAAGPITESAAVVGTHLYVGDETGMLYGLNAKTGHMEFAHYLSGALSADFPMVVGQTLYQPDTNGQLFARSLSRLRQAEKQPARLFMPAGSLAQRILQGQRIFSTPGLASNRLSCASCHVAEGTARSVRRGQRVPSLMGVASTFPRVQGGHVRTLPMQINHCIQAMGGQPLQLSGQRMRDLTLYLRWLSNGFPERVQAVSPTASHHGGGC